MDTLGLDGPITPVQYQDYFDSHPLNNENILIFYSGHGAYDLPHQGRVCPDNERGKYL